MQRSRLTTVLASLGLGACAQEREPIVEPASPPPTAEEPSGLGSAAKPAVANVTTPHEPHFSGVPTQFCHAVLQQHDDPLVKTQSLLQAWNELAPIIRNPLAHNIPATEIDARMMLCGAERCSIEAPKLAEVTADYMVGTGVLIPSDGALLVVPEIALPHVVSPCSHQTEIGVETHGELVHVRALTKQRRYNYGHGHHGYYNYDPVPMECQTYSNRRRDLIIDATRGELELIIDQYQAAEDGLPWIEIAFDGQDIVLSGCGEPMTLRWTE